MSSPRPGLVHPSRAFPLQGPRWRALEGAPPPRRALDRLRGLRGRVLLESQTEGGRISFLSADPVLTLAVRRGHLRVAGALPPGVDLEGLDVFRALETLHAALAMPPPEEGGPSFPGGIVGFLGYETAGLLERLPPPQADDLGLPEAWFGLYDWAVVWERESGRCWAGGVVLPGREPAALEARLAEAERRLETPPAEVGGPEAPGPSGGAAELRSSLGAEAFKAGVERIREYILAGDIFQANLTRRLTARSAVPASELFHRLSRESPAPYAAFVDTGEGEVASISPEQFLSLRSRRVETRPIKGTAPRSPDPAQDRRLGEGLLASEKDRAENVMIVDLLRNDLSRVCEDGSVEVPRLLALEAHPTVHHLVSTVRGRLRSDATPVDLLRVAFPGGSITGAPRIRAMEILRELEPVRRGVYTGALGILAFHGDMELSIAIRTAMVRAGRVHYGTGGGITLASDPEAEWSETVDKARAFVRALRGPEASDDP